MNLPVLVDFCRILPFCARVPSSPPAFILPTLNAGSGHAQFCFIRRLPRMRFQPLRCVCCYATCVLPLFLAFLLLVAGGCAPLFLLFALWRCGRATAGRYLHWFMPGLQTYGFVTRTCCLPVLRCTCQLNIFWLVKWIPTGSSGSLLPAFVVAR